MMNTAGMVQMRMFGSDEARWGALRAKNPKADGWFIYAVRTTGVYCRPNCAAKLALRQNVIFFSSTADAERAGFRRIGALPDYYGPARPGLHMLRETASPVAPLVRVPAAV